MIFTCPQCARPFEVIAHGQHPCPYCGHVHTFIEPPQPPAQPQPSHVQLRSSRIQYLWMARDILFHPNHFFSHMPDRPFSFALLFGLIASWMGTIVGTIYFSLAPSSMMTQFFPLKLLHVPAEMLMVISMVLAPLLFIVTIYSLGGIYTFLGTLLGAPVISFRSVAAVLSYGMGTSHLWNFLPLIGGFLSQLWAFITISIGLKHTTHLGYGRIIFIILLPFFLIFTFIIFTAFSVAHWLEL